MTVLFFCIINTLRIHVRLVAADDIPVKLTPRSPPKHGTKLDKWRRLEQRENALRRTKLNAWSVPMGGTGVGYPYCRTS